MNFQFLHAADLHLGSPLRGLARKDADLAERFAAASRDAFADLVEQALTLQVKFIVIAGDIFDGDWRDMAIGLFFNRKLAELTRAGIYVYLLKGNHDAEGQITRSLNWPEKVFVFNHRKPQSFKIPELKVMLHGQSFSSRDVSDNLAAGYPKPESDWLNIGVLHTACTGRPGHDSYAPCTPEQLARHGYDYWALGHVHAHEIVGRDPWIVYPGNLQGRHAGETGAKGAVLVSVEDGHIAAVRHLPCDRARWADLRVDLSGLATDSAVEDAVIAALTPVAAEAGGRLLALRLRLEGKTVLHGRLLADNDLPERMEGVAQQVASDIWLEKLRLATTAPTAPGRAASAYDLAQLIDTVIADPSFTEDMKREIDTLARNAQRKKGKKVESLTESNLIENSPDILAEARALLLGQLGES